MDDRVRNTINLFFRGIENIYPDKAQLKALLHNKKRLKVYQGFDPTGKDLHIGHLIGLMKLRQLQKLGHEIIILIGDGTGQAGDPSGKLTQRKIFFTHEELYKNSLNYKNQIKNILDFSGNNPASLKYNSEWLNKLTLVQLLNLFERFSVQKLIERDIFQKRIKNNLPINLREFIYPVLQGYDSVHLEVDIELGGSDQMFNMLTGRDLEKQILNKNKFAVTLPILTDSNGKKIGKSEGNVISLASEPDKLYAMIMSLSDDIILKGFALLTEVSDEKIMKIKERLEENANPMEYKKLLAMEIVKLLHGQEYAERAEESFVKIFQKKIQTGSPDLIVIQKSKIETALIDILTTKGIVKSKSEFKRLIMQKAIDVNGNVLNDPGYLINPVGETLVKIGKHKFYKIKIN